uniref:Cu and Ag efflux protein CusF n=1 Tax=Candidatus Kentrum sp. FM TaxID=2126340 RepID=A0A450S4I2_9GAMM|nr:MAG: Cu and Ag efflux protein CusF [Candidatus Kentron sp. FM]VFJ55867.1 MAG: Cu and Ag efflux protein CusF [Candidatus Kentron sp. FM]VFK07131.1 MAG: Cu and Ag efflux protein CusF [Candidatus Kentron sp. FM]
MNKMLFTAAIAVAMTLSQGAFAEEQASGHHAGHEMGHSQHEANETVKNSVSGTGIIHRVSRFKHKINLTHAPIPALNWPEMRMDLEVAEGVELKDLKPGEEISFELELGGDKVYRIIRIEKIVAH